MASMLARTASRFMDVATKSRDENRVEMMARRKGLRLMKKNQNIGGYFLKDKASGIPLPDEFPDLDGVEAFVLAYTPPE